jgi:hypothetical protein
VPGRERRENKIRRKGKTEEELKKWVLKRNEVGNPAPRDIPFSRGISRSEFLFRD